MSRISIVTALLLAATLACQPGCSKKPQSPVAQGKHVGTWMELDSAKSGGSVFVVKTGTPLYKKLTFAADNTFTLTIVDRAGKPVSPPQSAAGTWKVEPQGVQLTYTSDSLNAEMHQMRPAWITEVQLQGKELPEDRMFGQTEDSRTVFFKRIQ